jgi:dTDP-4-amino-4,6-dideoxygalactose transaminase
MRGGDRYHDAVRGALPKREGEKEAMYARKRFDIGWLDLLAGLRACAFERDGRGRTDAVEGWFGPDAFACLSVRSGFDVYLETLIASGAIARGDEVLMSALTIPDMWRVIEHHGLVPVPVDVEWSTLAPRPEAWRAAATPRTRLALVAHLFGTRVPLAPLDALRRSREARGEPGILVLEDCAQAFTGADFKGDPLADVSMFSFGPIKTATALAGGVLRVRDRAVLDTMRATQAAWPVQSTFGYAKRILKYAELKAISQPLLYSLFVRGCLLCGTTPDKLIQSTVRGFKGGDFFQKIRHRPSPALLALLHRRLERGSARRVADRIVRARQLVARIGSQVEIPGCAAEVQSFWIFAVLSNRPEDLVLRMQRAGFDATQAATMSALPAPAARPALEPREARAMLARIVYLPVYPELPPARMEQMAAVVQAHVRAACDLEENEVSATQLA